jgi:sulfur-oxidizing protein SoxX
MILLSKIRVGPWCGALCAAMIMIGPAVAADHELAAYDVVGDQIPASLTGAPGDPARGRAIAAGREGNCLACHNMPIPEQQFHGNIGPNLAGVGARLGAGALRLRLVDAKRLSGSTIMPSFYVVDGLQRVAPYYRGRPALNAEQIEDLVAYLSGLTEPPDVAQTR